MIIFLFFGWKIRIEKSYLYNIDSLFKINFHFAKLLKKPLKKSIWLDQLIYIQWIFREKGIISKSNKKCCSFSRIISSTILKNYFLLNPVDSNGFIWTCLFKKIIYSPLAGDNEIFGKVKSKFWILGQLSSFSKKKKTQFS